MKAAPQRRKSPSPSELRERLELAESTLDAIRSGQVDALVVHGPDGNQLYSLEGADRPYRLLVQDMHEGAAIISQEGFVLYANARFAAMLGLQLEEVTGPEFTSFFEPDSLPQAAEMIAHALESPVRLEATLRGCSREVPVQISLKPLHLDETYVCAVITDLSERKRSEELARSEALARAVLEQVREAVVVTDCDGRIIRASQAAQALARRDILQDSFQSAFPLVADAAGDPHSPGKYSMPQPGGTRVHLLVREGELRGGDGCVIGKIVSLSDVTAMQQAQHNLEQAVVRLHSANEELQQFAYAVSHDLQEPARMIAMFGQLVNRQHMENADPDFKQAIEYMVQGSQRMAALLNDLRQYLEVGEIAALESGPTDCASAAGSAVANLDLAIRETGAEIEIGPLPQVECQFSHVMQLFQNLIANALKYRSEAPPRVSITTTSDGERCTVCVRDNGMGIAAEHHERIFGVFKRLHGREIPGTGIGLAICQKIVEQYHGRIWVESKPGDGAAFYFTLPCAKAAG